jgi:hypothetical protein
MRRYPVRVAYVVFQTGKFSFISFLATNAFPEYPAYWQQLLVSLAACMIVILLEEASELGGR